MAFQVSTVVQEDATSVRVVYTAVPLAKVSTGLTDALNVSRYSVVAPQQNYIVAVERVPDFSDRFLLRFANPLVDGTYRLSVSGVVDIAGQTVIPYDAPFVAVSMPIASSVLGGAKESSILETLRRFIPKKMKGGKGVEAVLSAIAAGDQIVKEITDTSFAQLFLSRASGKYLRSLSEDAGVSIPKNLSTSDAKLQKLAIAVNSEKVTARSILSMLEPLYGAEQVRAYTDSALVEPYALEGGESLLVSLDGGNSVVVLFESSDFATSGQATAIEVATAITKSLLAAGSNAYALSTSDGKVRLISGTLGLGSVVKVVGGTAQPALQFPSAIDAWNTFSSTTWAVTLPETGVVRFSNTAASPSLALQNVRVGDYVVVTGSVFNSANRGSYTVTKVYRQWVSGVTYTQYFEVKNDVGVAQASAIQSAQADLMFFRPTMSIATSRLSVVATADGASVKLPATSSDVARGLSTAAYLQNEEELFVASASRSAKDGLVILTTQEAHGLAVGDKVTVSDTRPSYTRPSNSESSTGSTTSVNELFLVEAAQTEVAIGPSNPVSVSIASLSDFRAIAVGCIDTAGNNDSDLVQMVDFTEEVRSNGATKIGYSWTLKDNYPHKVYGAASVRLIDGTVLVCGGGTIGTGDRDTAHVYDVDSDTWSAVGNMNVTRRGHSLVVSSLSDTLGDALVIGDSDEVERYDIASNAWTNVTTLDFVIRDSAVVVLDSVKTLGNLPYFSERVDVLVIGGTIDGVPTNRCGYISDIYGYSDTGSMAYARVSPSFCKLPDGRIAVVGGEGYAANEIGGTPVPLSSCELYDPETEQWTLLPSLPDGVEQAQICCIERPSNTAYKGVLLLAVHKNVNGVAAHVLDLGDSTGWIGCANGSMVNFDFSAGAHTLSRAGVFFGTASDVSADLAAIFCIPNTDAKVVNGKLSGEGAVSSVLSDTEVELTGLEGGYISTTNGTAVKKKAVAGEYAGAYVFDPAFGVQVTSMETALTQRISRGVPASYLHVSDASGFAEEGWVVVNFGYSNTLGPIKHFGPVGTNLLKIDAAFVPSVSIPVGASVIQLAGKGARQPPPLSGTLFLTDVSAPRIAASTLVGDMAAAGVEVSINLSYPGDRGLGGEGLRVKGAPRLSLATSVWGGDDLDQELETLRGS